MKENMKQGLSGVSVQRGFTLVELMIAITLGLIVVTVALQLFLNSQRTSALQQGASNLQNASLFGLESILRDVRLTNLSASQPFMDNTTPQGGLVLTASNLSTKKNPDGTSGFTMAAGLVSASEIGESNLAGKQSDQLVIQYRNTAGNQFDCEGNALKFGDYVVQRYFLREDGGDNDAEPNKPLALACKAATYQNEAQASLAGMDGDGQVLISRVDHFSVLLGVARDGMNADCSAAAVKDAVLDCFGYISIKDYMALTTKPQIVSIKLGLLVRSADSVGKNKFFNPDKVYEVLATSAKLKTDTKNSLYARSVVTQTIAIRNGFGIQN